MLGVTAYLGYSIWHVLSGSSLVYQYQYQLLTVGDLPLCEKEVERNVIYFISSAMGKTRKVTKGFSFANNVMLENDLSLLSGRLYTDINGIVFILGLGLFISLVNCIVILDPFFRAISKILRLGRDRVVFVLSCRQDNTLIIRFLVKVKLKSTRGCQLWSVILVQATNRNQTAILAIKIEFLLRFFTEV